MALSSSSIFPLLALLLIVIEPSAYAQSDGKLGGRTRIEKVESNREVQELGRFCVEQYNRKLRSGGSPLLSFFRVVAGEQQVVSGIKYYLRIATRDRSDGHRRLFDAVVVVRPWAKAKDLLSFSPSAGYWH